MFFKNRPALSVEFIKKKLEDVIDVSNNTALLNSPRLQDIRIHNENIQIILTVTPEEIDTIGKQLTQACTQTLSKSFKKDAIRIILTHELQAPSKKTEHNTAPSTKAQWNQEPIPYVQNIILVASGKGGVGKSTTTMLLATSLAEQGLRIGVLDADIYGPSIPRMAGVTEKAKFDNKFLQPTPINKNLKIMSLGMLINPEEAAIMRGPMLSKTLHQLIRGTEWGTEPNPLDVLLIDTPPGTGDVHLSIAQMIPLHHHNGRVIIVTTPQEIALDDVRRCLNMFKKINIPCAGIIENMSYFQDPYSDQQFPIFGEGGGQKLSQEFDVPLLSKIPLDMTIREQLDNGKPTNNEHFAQIAKHITANNKLKD